MVPIGLWLRPSHPMHRDLAIPRGGNSDCGSETIPGEPAIRPSTPLLVATGYIRRRGRWPSCMVSPIRRTSAWTNNCLVGLLVQRAMSATAHVVPYSSGGIYRRRKLVGIAASNSSLCDCLCRLNQHDRSRYVVRKEESIWAILAQN